MGDSTVVPLPLVFLLLFSWSSLCRAWRAMIVCGRWNPWLRGSRAPLLSKPVVHWPRCTWRSTPALPLFGSAQKDGARVWWGLNDLVAQTKHNAQHTTLWTMCLLQQRTSSDVWDRQVDDFDVDVMMIHRWFYAPNNIYFIYTVFWYIATSNQLSVAIVTE